MAAPSCVTSHRVARKIAEHQRRPTWVASDDKNVYWMTEHEVVAIDKHGGAVRELAVDVLAPGRLVTDGEHAYWLDRGRGSGDGRLRRVSVGGGPVETLASQFSASEALVVDAQYVYWGAGERILRRAKTGGPDHVLAVDVDATALDVDGAHIYWSNADHDGNPRIGVADFAGNQEVLVGGPAPGFALSVRSTSDEICWTSRNETDSGGVWCLLHGRAIPRHLAMGEAWTFALRDGLIYWIRSGPGDSAELICTPLDGGASSILASGAVADVTADREHLYWSDIRGDIYEQ